MLKRCSKITLAALLVFGMCLSSLGGIRFTHKAAALENTSNVTYPFVKGADAFQYAPSFTTVGPDESIDHWEFIEAKMDGLNTVDLSGATCFAWQMRVDKGNPGITIGLIENGDRFNTSLDGKSMFFLDESGTLRELKVLYSAINLGENACGTLLMPVDQLNWQWNNNQSALKNVSSFYFTTNTLYNRDWKITLGEFGYYTTDPALPDAQLVKLGNMTGGERAKNRYYVDSLNPDCMEMPSDKVAPKPEVPQLAYPFRGGEHSYDNAVTWVGTQNGDANDNWQTLHINFDNAPVDFSKASYLVIQVNTKQGAPGLTYGLQNKSARYATVSDGKQIFFTGENESVSSKINDVLYSAVTLSANQTGALVIPMESMIWQFGQEEDQKLQEIEKLVITTNSKYNWGFEVRVGEIGYCVGEPGMKGFSFTKILDLTKANDDKFTVTADNNANSSTIVINKPVRETLGDVTVDVKGEGKKSQDFGIWSGGSYGKVEMTKDSYNEDAIKLTATGSNPSGDAYCAITLSGAGGFSWAGMQGVSFWARNDSDTEVSFNVEVDCTAPVIKNDQEKMLSDRFNIRQGNRYYMYDVNTGKTSIYMTRPTATLPVGFEGWIRIPFTAFNRAAWSNNGVTPEAFMSERSYVSYLAITIHASTYCDKSFTVNKFGGYNTIPAFRSAFVTDGSTIPELMGL